MELQFLVVVFLMASAISMQGAAAVDYQVTNNAVGTAGGNRFDSEIGVDHSRQVLSDASSFIWTTFQQAENERKSVHNVSLVVEQMSGVAYTAGNEIHMSTDYIASYQGDVKTEFDGVMYHEMTHVWQWNGNGATPGGLIEGIADFVRLKAGFAPSTWVQPGEGDRWNQGYDVTARFLDYCNDLGGGSFVANLNKGMQTGYSDSLFVQLLGETVDELWTLYKAFCWVRLAPHSYRPPKLCSRICFQGPAQNGLPKQHPHASRNGFCLGVSVQIGPPGILLGPN